ncbi:MAG: glucokinase [Pseudomonadota bacterium]
MTLLAGDIGGTKTLLQLFESNSDGFTILFEQRYISNHYDHLIVMIEEFLTHAKEKLSLASVSISKACFGIAGPIQGDVARVTNLPWVIKADELQQALDIEKVFLINDFKAIAYALKVLPDSDYCVLQQGKEKLQAPKVIIGAGTGLGSAFLFYTGRQYEVFSSESSHAAFAPINVLEIELLQFLRKKYQQVSYEHIVSGPGLVNIFEFLCSIENNQLSNELNDALTTMDKSAAISQFALNKTDVIAIQALDIFTQIYARQAANLALTSLAFGGVYIAGGIAPKIIEKLKDPEFLKHFKNNTNMGYLLEDMPLKVLMNANAGLIGAAVVAAS